MQTEFYLAKKQRNLDPMKTVYLNVKAVLYLVVNAGYYICNTAY